MSTKLREQFKKETGINWWNDHGANIEYVEWLEKMNSTMFLYDDIDDFEKSISHKVNDEFRLGFEVARTKKADLPCVEGVKQSSPLKVWAIK